MIENASDDSLITGNISLKSGTKTLEKSISEVIKSKDSEVNCVECMKHKHSEQWDVIDVDARNFFTCCTRSLIKCTPEVNLYGERIKSIDKNDKTVE